MIYQPNTRYADRYLLIQKLGSGGFSEVWLAEDTKGNNIHVAVKIFAPGNGLDSNGLKVFADEYSLVFHLNHPNLLKPSYFDEWNDQPYLVMQFMENGSCVGKTGKMKEAELAGLIIQIADALQYLHDQDPPIIHQDIKPDNILIDQKGNYLLTDFGISTRIRKTLTKSMGNQTVSSGTTAYMAPERFSRRLDERAPMPGNDIFSFGATMFEMLTDELPFGEQGGVLAAGGLEPAELPERFDATLRELISACLGKDVWKRPTAIELRDSAKSFLEHGVWLFPGRLQAMANQDAMHGPDAGEPDQDGRKKGAEERKTTVITEKEMQQVLAPPAKNDPAATIFAPKAGQQRPLKDDKATMIFGQQPGSEKVPGKGKFRIPIIAGVAAMVVLLALGVIFRDSIFGANSKALPYYCQISTDSRGEFFGRYPVDIEDADLVHCYHFRYDEHDRVIGWTYMKGGKPAIDPEYGIATIEIKRTGNVVHSTFKDLYGNPMASKRGVYGWEVLYGQDGFPTKERFRDKDGFLMMNNKGVASYTYTTEKDGMVIRIQQNDLQGEKVMDNDSIAEYECTYNEAGLIAEIRYFGLGGQPVPNRENGIYGMSWIYDEYGNRISEEYCDAGGRPMEQTDTRIARIDLEYNEQGKVIALRYRGVDGKLKPNAAWGFAMMRNEYDSAGNILKQHYLGADELPVVLLNTSIAAIHYQYDQWGNETERRFNDLNGNLKTHQGANYALLRQKFDDYRNIIEEQYFGDDEKPMLQQGFFSTHRNMYDNFGRKSEESYFGPDGNPAASTYTGWSAMKYQYDDQGRLAETKGYDTAGVLADSKYGYAVVRYEYGIDGKISKYITLDRDGNEVKI